MDLKQKLAGLAQRYEELKELMVQPDVLADVSLLQRYGREQAELAPVVQKYTELTETEQQLKEAQELYELEEGEMRDLAFEEMEQLKKRKEKLLEEIQIALLPKDIMDDKNAIVTIQGGAGGEEAALFAADLFRMYSRYADSRRWKIEVMDINETEQGGIRDVTFTVKGKGAYSRLKYEGGTHRVQRVPTTEAKGRIHTSTAKVIVLPEADDDIEIEIKDNDIRVDVYRSSGHGGQSVNTTDSAVRITHLPTGLVVTCQDEKSQLKNKQKALSVLKARLWDMEQARRQEEQGKARRSQVQTGDRSEKIRTYNFPQDRVTDHRIGLSKHNLPGILNGNIDEFIDNLITVEQAEKLQSMFAEV
ncbi:peptide chain release factor 1 [Thermosporothrix hazakensis]|jgi:peptide chain release factor 1|uniref:Peptide chain release factor 1 n=2 Tax=Thermosporothrix TaxID=768650 RepID=A0A326UDD3_THEHA|nr:peptide chain release factor 1 [Thermosporothrix hazakensis]PZW36508.1 peptide chain release factor 1 [Thermosporothrix hazakensis]BBH88975.1 peptide chain release factor 1 [Thermosporothrix sp. COM3]GCE47161.1 peptide chain release factor 1 [Thermosporothrix hazakensis]